MRFFQPSEPSIERSVFGIERAECDLLFMDGFRRLHS